LRSFFTANIHASHCVTPWRKPTCWEPAARQRPEQDRLVPAHSLAPRSRHVIGHAPRPRSGQVPSPRAEDAGQGEWLGEGHLIPPHHPPPLRVHLPDSFFTCASRALADA
jgi:hypothetical protein